MTRKDYYNIGAVFNMKCDGILGNSGGSYQTYYNQRNPVPSPVNIDIGIEITSNIDVTVYVTAGNNFSANNLNLQVALNTIAYDIPPGGWTYTHCEHAMLDMANNASGINFNIAAGETVELSTSFPFPTYPPGVQEDNLEIVAFVQNPSTQEVLQAELSTMPVDFPRLELNDFYVSDDAPGGNGNGRPEPGEECELVTELQNGYIYASATGITAELSTDDPGITIVNNSANYPDANAGDVVDNATNPFVFTVDENFEPHNVYFDLHIESDGGTYSWDETFRVMVGIPPLLIVDDDGGETYEIEIMTSLDVFDAPYDYYDINASSVPSYEEMSVYETLLWFTGRTTSTLDTDEQTVIGEFLDNGGNLIISSENLGEDIGSGAWYAEYMHATPRTGYITFSTLDGVEGNYISDGTDLTLNGGAYNPDSQSSLFPATGTETIYTYPNDEVGAISYAGSYLLVYCAFPIECVAEATYIFTRRSELLQNIFAWLDETVMVSMPHETAAPNSHISVPLTTGTINSANPVTSFSVEYFWNPAVLELDNPPYTLEGTILPDDWTSDLISVFSWEISGSCSGTTPLTGEGILLYLNFHVIGGEGSYTDIDIVSFEYNEPMLLAIGDGSVFVTSTKVEDPADISLPVEFAVTSIYPNPFNPETSISFSLPHDSNVEVDVYNLLGEKAAEVFNGPMNGGNHRLTFDGSHLASGVYLLKVSTDEGSISKKMVLMK